MRTSGPKPSFGKLIAALFIVFVVFLLVIGVANGWSPGIGGLVGPLVYLCTSFSREEDRGILSQPTLPAPSRSTTMPMPRPRPEQDPLWDRWLDG